MQIAQPVPENGVPSVLGVRAGAQVVSAACHDKQPRVATSDAKLSTLPTRCRALATGADSIGSTSFDLGRSLHRRRQHEHES